MFFARDQWRVRARASQAIVVGGIKDDDIDREYAGKE